MTREEKTSLEKTRLSLVHDGEHHQVVTPWKTDSPMLPKNYDVANSRLRNTEKRFILQTPVGEDYERVIAPYVDKGYIRKVQPKCTCYFPHFPVCHRERSTT